MSNSSIQKKYSAHTHLMDNKPVVNKSNEKKDIELLINKINKKILSNKDTTKKAAMIISRLLENK